MSLLYKVCIVVWAVADQNYGWSRAFGTSATGHVGTDNRNDSANHCSILAYGTLRMFVFNAKVKIYSKKSCLRKKGWKTIKCSNQTISCPQCLRNHCTQIKGCAWWLFNGSFRNFLCSEGCARQFGSLLCVSRLLFPETVIILHPFWKPHLSNCMIRVF